MTVQWVVLRMSVACAVVASVGILPRGHSGNHVAAQSRINACTVAPGPPTNFAATANGFLASLNWAAATGEVDRYEIRAGTSSGMRNIGAFDVGPTTTLNASAPAGIYYLAVVARNSCGVSGESNEVVLPLPQASCSQAPAAPPGFAVTASGTTLSFSWLPVTGAQRYRLAVGGNPGSRALGMVDLTAVTFSTPAPSGVYYAAVRAINDCGISQESSEGSAAIGGCSGPPTAPQGFAAAVSGSSLTLSWNAVGGAERYRLRAGSAPGSRGLATVDLGAANSFSASVPNGTYYLVVHALNTCGVSIESSEVVARIAPSTSPFEINMPVAIGDSANTSFGLNPFGIHFGGTGAGGHGLDGHPGWDIEYRLGASVLAAADGVVQSRFSDSFAPDRVTVQIQHQRGSLVFRTVYTNLVNVLPTVQPGAPISTGVPIGQAGPQTLTIGSELQTFAMTHFQTDDFRRSDGMTNPNAVNPEEFLSAAGAAVFDTIWRTAAYSVEITEPFPGNVRNVTFPFTRTWTRESGAHAARIDFVRREAGSSLHDYRLYDATGAQIEQGIATPQVVRNQARLDLQPQSGEAPRLGLLDIVGDTMRLDFGVAGAPRPLNLNNASTYRTTR